MDSIFSVDAKSNVKEGGRIGMIGLDTSHVVVFTKSLNEGQDQFELSGCMNGNAFHLQIDVYSAYTDNVVNFIKLSEERPPKIYQ